MRWTSTTPTPAPTRARSTSWSASATCAASPAIRSRRRRRPGSSFRPPTRRRAVSTTFTAVPRAMKAGKRNRGQSPVSEVTRAARGNRALTPVSRGFTYLAMLIAVGVGGAVLAAVGELASHAQQREKEADLLFAGYQIREAITAYYDRSPGGAKTYPMKLEDLLQDARMPTVQRYLRKVYRDPMTGNTEWGVVEGPNGGVMGVYSRSESRPLKSGHFARGDESFIDAKTYREWKFTHSPAGLVAPDPGTAKP